MKEQISDQEIIDRILHGEAELFEIIIRRYNPFLYKTGRSYNYNHEDTQDLMQDTFIDAYNALSKFEGRSSFKTWIIKIMLNNCFRHRQKSAFKNEFAETINEKSIPMFANNENQDTGKLFQEKELGSVIENALGNIPYEYRITFSLREINDLSTSETAEVLGISESNVKVRLNRAKSMLRKEIEKSYSPEEIFEFNNKYCDAMVERVMSKLQVKNRI